MFGNSTAIRRNEQQHISNRVGLLAQDLAGCINSSDVMGIVHIVQELQGLEYPSNYSAKIYVLDRYLIIKKGSVQVTAKCKR